MKKYIDSYYAHREVLNKSYKTTKPKFVDIKIPFVEKTSEIDKIKDQLNRSKANKDKKKISELFRIDSYMYTNLGTDSTKTERDAVKRKSKYIYRAIAKIDPKIGKEMLYFMDS